MFELFEQVNSSHLLKRDGLPALVDGRITYFSERTVPFAHLNIPRRNSVWIKYCAGVLDDCIAPCRRMLLNKMRRDEL